MATPPTPLTFTYKTVSSASSSPLEVKLDVFLPPNLPSSSSSSALPVLFAFHPGGFISYGRDHIPPWVFDLGRAEGWIVISPDYRLLIGGKEKGEKLDAGDCLDDVLAAYEWVVGGELDKVLETQGKGVKVDTKRISAVGFSIGGFLTQLLPSLIPSHLPPIKSVVSLYGVSRPTHPFYSTPRSSPDAGELKLKSLSLSPEFNKVCSDLFTRLWSSETIPGELDYTPEQKRELEKVGAEGYRGMLWDWAVEQGIVLDLLLGKGVEGFIGQGKNDSLPSSSSTLENLTARIQPFTGPNTLLPSHPPTLLIHGDSDTLVPFSDSIWSLGKLAEAGIRTKYVSVPGVDHGFDGAVGLVEGGEDGEGRYDGLWREVREWIEGGW